MDIMRVYERLYRGQKNYLEILKIKIIFLIQFLRLNALINQLASSSIFPK